MNMKNIAISKLSSDVAALLGESLLPECATPESPFPDLEDSVRILAPGFLAELLLASDSIDISASAVNIPGTPQINSDGVVSLDCPDDFLRIISLKMSDWRCPVTALSIPSDPDFRRLFSLRDGIRGNPERPVAFLSFANEGKRTLKMLSSKEGARLEIALYVARPTIDSAGYIKIPDGLYHPLLIKLKEYFSKG